MFQLFFFYKKKINSLSKQSIVPSHKDVTATFRKSLFTCRGPHHCYHCVLAFLGWMPRDSEKTLLVLLQYGSYDL